ncbi:MAG TPA: GNAT family N-acetyltransferase [Candidatus Faecousia intestinigallinarum]|nr:GNAT family N-acetyltransferase [Candidatus Faecousia intestinigallinarum]
MIRNYLPQDGAALLRLWNSAGVSMGYAPLEEKKFRELLLEHPDFSPEFTFVLEEEGKAVGFVNGCTGDHIPRGDVRGYVSCLLLSEDYDTQENTAALLSALEDAFRRAGRSCSAVTFFNPIRLPWILPGTPGHQHNNAPGIARDLPLYGRMLDLGYREAAGEMAMHLDLAQYETPAWVEKKAEKMAQEGYTVAPYDPKKHHGLREMLEALENPMWISEITMAGETGMELLVGLCGDTVAGFTGPIYPEATGRGYFAGIGVAPQFERHGLGSLLFYRLCRQEKAAGAKYMSLFTGEENPAQKIYLGAGFTIVRRFGVMLKEI